MYLLLGDQDATTVLHQFGERLVYDNECILIFTRCNTSSNTTQASVFHYVLVKRDNCQTVVDMHSGTYSSSFMHATIHCSSDTVTLVRNR